MTLRNALLGLLRQRSRHGYDLTAAMQALVGGRENWDLKPAQVYAALMRMAAAGLVSPESLEKDGGPEKRVFALTTQGEQALRDWFSSEPDASQPLGDELFLKLMLALMEGEERVRQVIQNHRAALYRELHRVTSQRTRTNPRSHLALVLLMDKRIMHLEADLRWLDMVEARLDDMADQPIPQPAPRPRGRPPKQL
ncbi:MAG: PadR family transcriptional regulator [Bellilinea sp.]|jgi:DNA-binding PadR family transcriptional regulator